MTQVNPSDSSWKPRSRDDPVQSVVIAKLLRYTNQTVNDGVAHSRIGTFKGGATIFKVGGTSSLAPLAKKIFFDPPTFGTWGDIKQDITVFITAIMTYKR